jgi:hypothetical protein
MITRSDGSVQATFDRAPQYTYVRDTRPAQNKGSGLNVGDRVWHEVTAAGAASAPATSSGLGGYVSDRTGGRAAVAARLAGVALGGRRTQQRVFWYTSALWYYDGFALP